jgi:hypothetical protein
MMRYDDTMTIERPALDVNLDPDVFKEFYYLKAELMEFCRSNGLQTTGSKPELNERIYVYLSTGEKMTKRRMSGAEPIKTQIALDMTLGPNFRCSEKHREFFKENIGEAFKFNVEFLNWLRSNADKTYNDAIAFYYITAENKKNRNTIIGVQFEYNTYIRDFFNDNKGRTLSDAIRCWKYKKSLPGKNKYERNDLSALM